MSFIARKNKTDSVKDAISADQVLSAADRERDYYCPGCTCVFRYRAASSNARAAHFFRCGNHEPGCWMPLADSISGEIDASAMRDISLQQLYHSIICTRDRSGKGVGTAGGGTRGVAHIKPTTIRNLYKYCCHYPNNASLGRGLTVKDVFAGRKTSFLYIKYVKGIHLIECQYDHYKKECHSIFFQYPFGRSPVLKIQIHFNDESLFWHVQKQLFKQKAPVLIFSEWEMKSGNVYTEILNSQQIVPLSGRRE